jgi:hypothetical protein
MEYSLGIITSQKNPPPKRDEYKGRIEGGKAQRASLALLVVQVGLTRYASISAEFPPRLTVGKKFIPGCDFEDAVPAA